MPNKAPSVYTVVAIEDLKRELKDTLPHAKGHARQGNEDLKRELKVNGVVSTKFSGLIRGSQKRIEGT